MKKRNEAKYMQYLKRNKSKGVALGILSLLIIVLTVSILYVDYIKKLTYEHIYHNINELSEQTATQLNTRKTLLILWLILLIVDILILQKKL